MKAFFSNMSETVNDSLKTMQSGYLDGQLLIAMPSIADPRFNKAVIYVCAHSTDGAMGIVINQKAAHISFSELLEQLEILPPKDSGNQILIPKTLDEMSVHMGGPVETGRGFVLHSADYFANNATLPIDKGIHLTATVDILKAIASGHGPSRALLALGYAGWSPGQLESEIQANGWLNCPADPEIVFDRDLEHKYHKALGRIGVDPSHLVNDIGHA